MPFDSSARRSPRAIMYRSSPPRLPIPPMRIFVPWLPRTKTSFLTNAFTASEWPEPQSIHMGNSSASTAASAAAFSWKKAPSASAVRDVDDPAHDENTIRTRLACSVISARDVLNYFGYAKIILPTPIKSSPELWPARLQFRETDPLSKMERLPMCLSPKGHVSSAGEPARASHLR